ncbi:hypothetical protein WP1_029 [Pseudomonas phage WP1]
MVAWPNALMTYSEVKSPGAGAGEPAATHATWQRPDVDAGNFASNGAGDFECRQARAHHQPLFPFHFPLGVTDHCVLNGFRSYRGGTFLDCYVNISIVHNWSGPLHDILSTGRRIAHRNAIRTVHRDAVVRRTIVQWSSAGYGRPTTHRRLLFIRVSGDADPNSIRKGKRDSIHH